jgi:hypothetical protein
MAKTREANERAGYYRSLCCGDELPLALKEEFPQCRKCSKAASWILVKPTQAARMGPAAIRPGMNPDS